MPKDIPSEISTLLQGYTLLLELHGFLTFTVLSPSHKTLSGWLLTPSSIKCNLVLIDLSETQLRNLLV